MNQRKEMDITPRQKSLIIVRILRWYRKYGRDLPWRNVHDPYRILVSEVMLQQTQVSRVLTKYRGFLRRFPSLRRLAKAKTSDVIKSWEGMGYNSRALRLQKLAVIILEEHKGKLPESIQELETLPGIGRYTAHALACFSFGQHVPIVDTNVKRVLTRVCHPRDRASVTGKEDIWDLADSLLPPQQSHDWNQALMDLGATICTAAQPRCNHCPLVDLCPSAHRVRRREPVTKKTEPGRGGIPNRIYRGRTIQALRELKTHGATTRSALARRVKPDFKSTDRPWFEFLLQALEKDGLIRIRARNRISLPE